MKKKNRNQTDIFFILKTTENKTFLSEGAKFWEHYTVEGLGN